MIKKLILITFICFLTAACNKESLFEGFVPEYKEVVVDQDVFVINASPVTIDLIDQLPDGNSLKMTVSTKRMKAVNAVGYDANTVAANDSVISVSIRPNVGAGGCVTAHNGYSLQKFDFGSELTTSAPTGSGSLLLMSAYKKSPYTGNFISLNHTSYGSISFSSTDEGYLSFFRASSKGDIYGWIKVQVTPGSIHFDKIGYKTFSKVKAGKNE